MGCETRAFLCSLKHGKLLNEPDSNDTPSTEAYSFSTSPNISIILNPARLLSPMRANGQVAEAVSQTKVTSSSSIFLKASKSSTKKACLLLGLLAMFISSA